MKLQIITIVLLFTINNLLGKSSDHIEIFTEHAPPTSMMIDGKLAGTYVELLDAMLKEMKSEQSLEDVRLINWSRAYSVVQEKKNTMVFSAVRTKEREKLFKWVGPISQTTIGIIALKSKKIKINKISDLNKYRVGTVLKDIGELLLLSNGVKKSVIQYVKGKDAIDVSFRKMDHNRIDVFSYDVKSAFSGRKARGFDMSKYEVVYVVQTLDSYFAFNKHTDDDIINKWQKALDEIKANGLYAKILKK